MKAEEAQSAAETPYAVICPNHGQQGRDWELAMQAQADSENEDRENEGEDE